MCRVRSRALESEGAERFDRNTTVADSFVFEQRVASGLDNVEERSSGSLSFNSSDLELVDDGSHTHQTIGLRSCRKQSALDLTVP